MSDQLLFVACVAVGIGLACTIAELLHPARPLSYRRVILADIAAYLVYEAAVVPIAGFFTRHAASSYQHEVHLFERFASLPLVVRLLCYYVLADFGTYWMHRLLHTRHVWRVHRWHHAPRYMYWFAGIRATLPQQLLFNLPYVLVAPLLAQSPTWVIQFVLAEVIVRNDWMHMNVTWRSNWLEWVFVTPRFHHIHHCPDYAGNYGSLFSIWDRLFGTRIDPEAIPALERFGTGEDDHRLRLVAGV